MYRPTARTSSPENSAFGHGSLAAQEPTKNFARIPTVFEPVVWEEEREVIQRDRAVKGYKIDRELSRVWLVNGDKIMYRDDVRALKTTRPGAFSILTRMDPGASVTLHGTGRPVDIRCVLERDVVSLLR